MRESARPGVERERGTGGKEGGAAEDDVRTRGRK